jgi:hypothetical protein
MLRLNLNLCSLKKKKKKPGRYLVAKKCFSREQGEELIIFLFCSILSTKTCHTPSLI